MKRFAVVIGLVVLAGACDKPSEENCRKALSNMRALLNTEAQAGDVEGDVRRCKGGSSKKSVECAMNAKTVSELEACGFLKVPDKKPDEAGAGAAPGSAGSAAPAPPPGTAPGAAPDTTPAAPGAAPAAPAGAAPADSPAGAAPADSPAGAAPAAPAGAAPAAPAAQ